MPSSVLVRLEGFTLGLGLISLVVPRAAWADAGERLSRRNQADAAESRPAALARTPRDTAGYQHWMGGAFVGKGLRFNNPYRLGDVLGDDAESLSLSATYLDLHVGRTFSPPGGWEHGVTLHLAVALEGIRQEVATPSYLLLKRLSPRVLSYGRAGFPIVLEPDASVGLEAGLGTAYFLTANLGVGLELAFSLFYGAGTIERAVTAIPMTSLSAGVFFDWERLP